MLARIAQTRRAGGAPASGLAVLAVLAVLLVFATAAWGEETSLPPGPRPVEVHAGFFLVNLTGVAERNETFDADLYLSFRWRDTRLALAGGESRRYVEDAAVARLGDMWWPDIEFVNTASPEITNRSLEISPDGTVEYVIGVTSTFRANLDLRRFPFDQQTLEVRIESFLWSADEMTFVADPDHVGFNPENTFEGLVVRRADVTIRKSELAGWGKTFSELVALVDVERQAAYYLWTVFAPVSLIFLISCTVFVVPIENFHDRVGISLAALLACIATQFAMSFNLPQISYLTAIDRVFLVTYVCVALGVLISTVQAAFLRGNERAAARIDRLAGFGLPTLYFALLGLYVLL